MAVPSLKQMSSRVAAQDLLPASARFNSTAPPQMRKSA
jgi:hypothetical protein